MPAIADLEAFYAYTQTYSPAEPGGPRTRFGVAACPVCHGNRIVTVARRYGETRTCPWWDKSSKRCYRPQEARWAR